MSLCLCYKTLVAFNGIAFLTELLKLSEEAVNVESFLCSGIRLQK